MKLTIKGRPVPAVRMTQRSKFKDTSAQKEGSELSDYERAQEFFRVLCPESEFLKFFVIEGEPQSKSRPRMGNGKVYNTAKQKNNEEYLAWNFKKHFEKPLTHNLAIGCLFYRPNNQRIDVDNMLKNVMDAANGIIYVDDCQVTAKLGVAELDKDRPRTVIIVGRHVSTLIRDMNKTLTCPKCKNEFEALTPYWNKHSKFCSRECASLSKGEDLRSLVKCLKCSIEFRRKTAAQKYCSEKCRMNLLVDLNKGKRIHEKSHCKGCGKEVSRPEYVRCRECWKVSF